jgi:hypothetical protein
MCIERRIEYPSRGEADNVGWMGESGSSGAKENVKPHAARVGSDHGNVGIIGDERRMLFPANVVILALALPGYVLFAAPGEILPPGRMRRRLDVLCVPKFRFCNIDDEGRRERVVM